MSQIGKVDNHRDPPEGQAKADEVDDPPSVDKKSTVLLFHQVNFLTRYLMSRKSDGSGRQVDYKLSCKDEKMFFGEPGNDIVTIKTNPPSTSLLAFGKDDQGEKLKEWLGLKGRSKWYDSFLPKSFHI